MVIKTSTIQTIISNILNKISTMLVTAHNKLPSYLSSVFTFINDVMAIGSLFDLLVISARSILRTGITHV